MTDWAPGDPLHEPPTNNHSNYFFNFRDDSTSWMDAASWPDPRSWHALTDGDDLPALLGRRGEVAS